MNVTTSLGMPAFASIRTSWTLQRAGQAGRCGGGDAGGSPEYRAMCDLVAATSKRPATAMVAFEALEHRYWRKARTSSSPQNMRSTAVASRWYGCSRGKRFRRPMEASIPVRRS